MVKKIEELPGVPPRRAPYSVATIAGGFAFLSGQGPFTLEDQLVEGTFEEQADQTFRNVVAIVSGLGKSVNDVVRVGIYLQDMGRDFAQMNEIYSRFFPSPYPARTTIPATGLRFALEVDAVVWVGDSR